MFLNIAVAQLWADGRLFFFSARGLIAAVFVRYRTMVFADRAHTQHTRAAHPRILPNLLLQSSSTKWTAPKQTVFLGESQPTATGAGAHTLGTRAQFVFPARILFSTRPQCNARPKRMPPLLAIAP